MRKITVFSMADNSSNSITTSATTWGEVLSASSAIAGMVMPDMSIVIKETKAIIASNETVLPDQDIKIFLTPGKVKSGTVLAHVDEEIAAVVSAITDEVAEAIALDITNIEEIYDGRIVNVVQEDPLPF